MNKTGKRFYLSAIVLAMLTLLAVECAALKQDIFMESPGLFFDERNAEFEFYVEAVVTGYCGGNTSAHYVPEEDCYDNVTWTLYDNGCLLIEGTGAMKDYSETDVAPWKKYEKEVTILQLGYPRAGASPSTIGDYAFYNFGHSVYQANFYCGALGRIGAHAFDSSGIYFEDSIASSVSWIGEYAFRNCDFGPWFDGFPYASYIGEHAFDSSTKPMPYDSDIPSGITSIAPYAYYRYDGFDNIKIPSGVTKIGEYAFCGCTNYGSEIWSLSIPGSVQEIGVGAFSDLYLYLVDIKAEGNFKVVKDVLYDAAGKRILCCTYNGSDPSEYFISPILPTAETGDPNNGVIRSLKITDDVPREYTAGDCANGVSLFVEYFNGYKETRTAGFTQTPAADAPLTEADTKLTVEYLGYSVSVPITVAAAPEKPGVIAFGCCGGDVNANYVEAEDCYDNLTWILDSDGVLTIEGEGKMKDYYSTGPWYSYKSMFTALHLGEGITSIGQDAFYNCTGFTGELVLPDSLTCIEGEAFLGCGFTGELVLPDGLTYIGYEAFTGCGFTGDLVIPDSMTSVDYMAFEGCKFTGKLILPDGLTCIYDSAFSGCGFTGELILPDSLTYIGGDAFFESSFTGELVLPDGLTYIGYDAFWGSSFTGNLVIPDSMTSIAWMAFTGSKFSGKLILPDGLTYIEDSAFSGCSITGELVLPDSLTSIDSWAFCGCGFTGDLILPDSLTYIGEYAFGGCGFTGELVLPDGLTSIEDGTFSYCSFTGELVLPEGVTSIGDSAFYNTPISSVYCMGDAPSILMTFAPPFNSDVTIYYLESTSGWTDEAAVQSGAYDPETGLWYGYEIQPFTLVSAIAPAADFRTSYTAGECLDNLSVTVTYFDGTTETLSEGFEQIPAADVPLTAADTAVTISYKDGAVSVPITVTEPEIPDEPSENAVRFTLADAFGTQGQQICVPVSIANNTGFTGLALDVTFDPAILTLTGVIDAGLIPGAIHAPDYASPYTLTWENDLSKENLTAEGIAAYLVFTVNADAPAGDVSVRLTIPADGVIGADGGSVEAAAAGCTVTVTDFLYGDVNSDGEVTPLDRMILARYLAHWADYPASMVNPLAADVNRDGQVTSKDRMILARYLAGWSGYEALPYGAAPVPGSIR